MKEKMRKIITAFHKYNTENMAFQVFGLSNEMVYNALIVAPGFTPFKIINDEHCKITLLREGSYRAGYLVEKEELKIAWIKTSSGAGNVIDHISICAELKFKKMIFLGSVGSLTENYKVGDICTPGYSISGGYTNTYLKDSIKDFTPFERVEPDIEYVDKVIDLISTKGYDLKKASVFCTDSIMLEYYHLDEIKNFHTDLIEMETSSFYLMADLMEIPSIALLVVSDNSATGTASIGRTEQEQENYDISKKVILPDMLFQIVKTDL